VGYALSVVVVAVAGAALVLGVIVPRVAGATPFVVLTDSMEPSLPVGTLIVSRPVAPEQISTGSVITYQVRSGEEQLATHRVVGLGTTVDGERTYLTQGDANDVADPLPVRDAQVRGMAWYHVPYLGHVASMFTGQREAVAIGAAVLLLGYAGWQVVRAARERAARRLAPVPDRPGPGSPGPVGPGLVGPGLVGTGRAGTGPVEDPAEGGAR
jgi:signal peptidase